MYKLTTKEAKPFFAEKTIVNAFTVVEEKISDQSQNAEAYIVYDYFIELAQINSCIRKIMVKNNRASAIFVAVDESQLRLTTANLQRDGFIVRHELSYAHSGQQRDPYLAFLIGFVHLFYDFCQTGFFTVKMSETVARKVMTMVGIKKNRRVARSVITHPMITVDDKYAFDSKEKFEAARSLYHGIVSFITGTCNYDSFVQLTQVLQPTLREYYSDEQMAKSLTTLKDIINNGEPFYQQLRYAAYKTEITVVSHQEMKQKMHQNVTDLIITDLKPMRGKPDSDSSDFYVGELQDAFDLSHLHSLHLIYRHDLR